jgi:hypothetical protein
MPACTVQAIHSTRRRYASIRTWLRRLFSTTTASTTPYSGLIASPPQAGDGSTDNVPAFVTVQSLTSFGVMSVLIQGIWTPLRLIPPLDSRWVPFALCLLFGVACMAAAAKKLNGAWEWGLTSTLTIFNVLALFSAVLGATNVADAAKDAIG